MAIHYWSDDSKLNLFGNDGRVFVRTRIEEDLKPECRTKTMKVGGGSVIVWECNSCDAIDLITKEKGRMNGKVYIKILS